MKIFDFEEISVCLSKVGDFSLQLLEILDPFLKKLNRDLCLQRHYRSLKTNTSILMPALKQLDRHEDTMRIVKLDNARNNLLTTIRRQIDVYEFSEDSEEQQVYQSAIHLMRSYGHIESLCYEEKTVAIHAMLGAWHAPINKSHAGMLNLKGHLFKLKKLNSKFDVRFTDCTMNHADRIAYNVRTLRKEILMNYTDLVQYVTVMAKNAENDMLYARMLDAIHQVSRGFVRFK